MGQGCTVGGTNGRLSGERSHGGQQYTLWRSARYVSNKGYEMLLILGALLVFPGTIAVIIDDRKIVKWPAWIAIYLGILLILLGLGGPAAVRDAIESASESFS